MIKNILKLLIACFLVSGCTQGINNKQQRFLTSDFDVSSEEDYPMTLDWSINTSDPLVLKEVSELIVSGKIKSIEGTEVDASGLIKTRYVVEVETFLKGDAPDIISVLLPGGYMSLGEYITKLDEKGIYNNVFVAKSNRLLEEKGIDQSKLINAREEDQAQIIAHNFNANPTSRSFLNKHTPEAFVLFLNKDETGVYYPSVFNHSMKYEKDGMLYSVGLSEAFTKPFKESALVENKFR